MRSSHSQSSLKRTLPYLTTTALVAAFGALQWYLSHVLSLQMTYLLFFPPIMISAWFGGGRCGMLATLLSALLVDYLFLKPLYQFGPIGTAQLWTPLIFVIEGFFVSALGEARLQSHQAFLHERNSLEQRVAERTREISAANEQLANQVAEREKAQAALGESESKFRSVVETASDAVVLSDQDGKIIAWNRAAQEMFGYSAEEVLNQSLSLIIPVKFKASHEDAMARLRQGAPPRLMGQHLELRGCRRDGSEFPLELSLATWQEGDQKFYSGIIRDMTLRQQAEENRVRLIEEMAARAESEMAEQRYRLLAEAIPQIVWTATPEGGIDYFNQHWFEYTGLTLEQSLGWSWQQALHPDDRRRSLESWKQAVESGTNFELEYRFRHHSGAYRWHLGRAVPLYADEPQGKRIVKWFGTCTDIELQKSTEANSRFLAKAMSQLTVSLDEQAIVQTLASSCAPTLADFCVVDLLTAGEYQKFQMPDGEVPHGEMTPGATQGPTQGALRRATNNGDADTKSYQAPASGKLLGPWHALARQRTEKLTGADLEALVGQDSILEEWRDVITSCSDSLVFCVPLVVRGRPLGVLSLLCANPEGCIDEADIGIAEDLARNAALLIENARLLRETQQANRAKDEFLAVLSHELRTPLTAVLGWVQLLQHPQVDEETRLRALHIIERNSNAQVQLIEDLLDLSRIITGKLHLETKPINIHSVLEAALDVVRPAAQDKEIALFFSPDPLVDKSDDLIMGDGHRLQQVFWNLLSNSIKFTPQGGRIEILLRHLEHRVEISVHDNGRGISAEFLPHVFERFRQADSSSTRQHGGLGLGLALVQHVVELHGGRVQVESKGANQGTTFKVMLPLSPQKVAETPSMPSSKPLELSLPAPMLAGFSATLENAPLKTKPQSQDTFALDPQLLQGVRVMLVDDEPDALDMLSAVLRSYGADVQPCTSVQEALEILPQLLPRVLVSDIGMPGRDGYDLIRSVRSLPQDKGGDVPAMALTAYGRVSDRDLALGAGFDRHVIKPVDPVALARQVAELAHERSSD